MRRAALPRRGRPPPRFGINKRTRPASHHVKQACHAVSAYSRLCPIQAPTPATNSPARPCPRPPAGKQFGPCSPPAASAVSCASCRRRASLPRMLFLKRGRFKASVSKSCSSRSRSLRRGASCLQTPSAGLLTPRGWPEARSPARCARLRRRGCSGRGRRRRLSSRPQAQGPCPPAPRPSGRA